ncbi:MAG: class I adenylate-forming enzyme family protein [Bacilli bacterium]
MIEENKNLETEDIERNLYLRTLLTGERLGPLTGKPSIDRPWLINYSNEEIASTIPKRRLYTDLVESSKDFRSSIAIEYYKNKITYDELIKNIDKAAIAFSGRGIKKGDVVSICMPYVPETVYAIYALNKIGAVINVIDPRINKELIKEYMLDTRSSFAIVIDKAEKKIASIVKDTKVKNVITVPATNSVKNTILKKVGNKKTSLYKKWDNFIKEADGKEDVAVAEFTPDELAVIEYTSGTSGKPKGVKLANESFNALSYFQKQSLKNEIGDKFLLIMPPFIAYGLVIGMHDMLCQGQHLLMIPKFTLDEAPKLLGKLVDKHHPNYIMGVPNFLLILMNYKKDLSFLKGIIIGGDHLDKEIEKKAIEYLKEHGSSAKVLKGWGMTEIASCGSFTKTDIKNKLGSVGIPISKNIIKILPRQGDFEKRYNIDSEELYYNEEGTMFISSPSKTLGYYKNEEATSKIFYVDKDGRKWINTGDIFKMDEDGHLFFMGREKRVVVRPDGHNIPSNQIESIAASFEDIELPVVIGSPSRLYAHGSIACLCMTLKNKNISNEEKEEILKQIEKKCKELLQPRDRAKYYIILNNIPYTMNGKVDYVGLTNYINEIIKERNISDENKESTFIIEKNDAKVKKRKK